MRGFVTDAAAAHGVRLAEDLPEPIADATRDEVIVEVHATSINRGEVALVAERPNGFRPGQDVAGVVASGPNAGARVVGIVDWHGWAERVAIPWRHVAALPDALSFAEAATLPVAGITALRAVRAGGDLLGRRVLVVGAAGGVGQIAVQLAAASGAEVTAVVRSAQPVAGAHRVVTAVADDEPPFDLVLDGVGGAALVEALHHLAPCGTLVMYGALGGKAALDIFDFARCPNAKLVALFLDAPGEHAGEELGALVHLLAAGRLRPRVSLSLPWPRLPEALAAVRAGKVAGKAVVVRDTMGG